MGLIRRRMLRRLGPLGRIADAFLVAGFALRFAHRKGWVTDELMYTVGLDSAVDEQRRGGASIGPGDVALGAGALWRLIRRRR